METVTVACKLPHGLVLRIHKQQDEMEPTAGGGMRKVKVWRPDADSGPITVRGYLEKYDPKNPPTAKGSDFALTEGVSKEFWETWLKQNQELDLVKRGLIFADEKRDVVTGLMKDMKDQRSGLEPIDPDKLPKGIQTYRKDAA